MEGKKDGELEGRLHTRFVEEEAFTGAMVGTRVGFFVEATDAVHTPAALMQI